MSQQKKFALRERSDGQVRYGWENDYPKCGGWKEVIGVPASYHHTTRLDYKDTLAERDAIKAIKHKVIVFENKEWARRHNANLYWDELDRQYEKHNVNPKFRKQRPLEVTVEPRSTAEAICEDAGVPKEMASQMIVMTIS